MEEKKIWYLDERAERLAIVYLSRRDDLVITRQPGSDYGLDFLVGLVKDGEYTGRVFGVEVKAKKSHQQIQPVSRDADEIRLDVKNLSVHQDIPFPLCLFVFTMDDDEGYYRWIKQPACNGAGEAQLLFNDDNTFKRLNNEAIDDIVTATSDWYENKLQASDEHNPRTQKNHRPRHDRNEKARRKDRHAHRV